MNWYVVLGASLAANALFCVREIALTYDRGKLTREWVSTHVVLLGPCSSWSGSPLVVDQPCR